jgi:hypothetical protein
MGQGLIGKTGRREMGPNNIYCEVVAAVEPLCGSPFPNPVSVVPDSKDGDRDGDSIVHISLERLIAGRTPHVTVNHVNHLGSVGAM